MTMDGGIVILRYMTFYVPLCLLHWVQNLVKWEKQKSQGNLFLMLIFNELLKSTGNFIILKQQASQN